MGEGETVRVYLRVRPANDREKQRGFQDCIATNSDSKVNNFWACLAVFVLSQNILLTTRQTQHHTERNTQLTTGPKSVYI